MRFLGIVNRGVYYEKLDKLTIGHDLRTRVTYIDRKTSCLRYLV